MNWLGNIWKQATVFLLAAVPRTKLQRFEETEEDFDANPEAVALENSAERVAQQIIGLPANSTAGRRVKARVFLYFNQGMVDRKIGMDDIVLASLLGDLLADDADEKKPAAG